MIIVSDKTRATVSVEEKDRRPAESCSRTDDADQESEMNCPSSGKSQKDSTKEPGRVRKATVIRNKGEDGSKGADKKPHGCNEAEDIRRFKGDGLSVKMDSNNRVLVVKGDGCSVTLARNSGRIRVVGDGCSLKVGHNIGYIEYEGDGGRVLLGPRSLKERVKYVGDGGQISFNHSDKNSTSKQQSPRHASRKAGESSSKGSKSRVECEQDAKSSVKKIVTTTATTVTTVENGKKSVEKWFVDPTSVITSFAGLNLKL